MITVILGDDVAGSRQKFIQIRQECERRGDEIMHLAPEMFDQIDTLFASLSLFASKISFFAENILSKKAYRDRILDRISPITTVDLVIWEETLWEAQAKRYLPGAQIIAVKLEGNIFKLMDSLTPGAKDNAYSLLNQVLAVSQEAMVLRMLQKRVRALILAHYGEFETAMAAWARSRLQTQSKRWEIGRLLSFYETLYRIEVLQKSGDGVYNIGQSLEVAFCYYL